MSECFFRRPLNHLAIKYEETFTGEVEINDENCSIGSISTRARRENIKKPILGYRLIVVGERKLKNSC